MSWPVVSRFAGSVELTARIVATGPNMRNMLTCGKFKAVFLI